MFKDTGTGYVFERQGEGKTHDAEGNVLKRFASSVFKLGKVDTFEGEGGEAKAANRTVKALEFKRKRLAGLVGAVMGDDTFIPTVVRNKVTEKTHTVAFQFHKVKVLEMAERLAQERGGAVEDWRKALEELTMKLVPKK
jgi:hypothetical protein